MAPSWKLLSFLWILWSSPASAASPQPAATFPPHGGAFVTSLPAAASAWLDGSFVGQTPVYVDDLLPGRHSLTFSHAGWQPETALFDVVAGRITPVSIVMQRVSQPGVSSRPTKGQGLISVRGGVAGSKVFVDGNSVGTLPIEAKQVEAGFHIVTVEPPGKNVVKSTRVVDVFPDTTTAVELSVGSVAAPTQSLDDILEPIDSVVPASNVVISGNDVTIHFHGIEVECAIGSRSYRVNGKAGTFTVSPALVNGRVYLPQSILARLTGK